MITRDQWLAIWDAAGAAKDAAAVPTAGANNIKGRFISVLAAKLIKFWGKYRAQLIPFVTHLVISALDSLVAASSDIAAIDPPGPN